MPLAKLLSPIAQNPVAFRIDENLKRTASQC